MLICLPACGTTSVAALSSKATPTPESLAATFNKPAQTQTKNMIMKFDGMHCQGKMTLSNTARTSYDQATLAAIKHYAGSYFGDYVNASSGGYSYAPETDTDLPTRPTSLSLLPGGTMCDGLLSVTNTSTTPLRITKVSLTILDERANALKYPLIDVCSLFSPCQFGGVAACLLVAQFTFHSPKKGATLSAGLKSVDGGRGDCPSQTIAPKKTKEIYVQVGSASSYLYRIRLALTLEGQTAPITLPASFNNTLTFATRSRMQCYALDGQAFRTRTLPSQPTYAGLFYTGGPFPCL